MKSLSIVTIQLKNSIVSSPFKFYRAKPSAYRLYMAVEFFEQRLDKFYKTLEKAAVEKLIHHFRLLCLSFDYIVPNADGNVNDFGQTVTCVTEILRESVNKLKTR